jgi:hypothetical protein
MRRGRGILLIFLFGSLATAGLLTYKRWPQLFRQPNHEQPAPSPTPDGLLSVPPFSTKEPDRYQATRIITSVEDQNGTAVTLSNKIFIARDGEKRREEYSSDASGTVVYLTIAEGRFVLLPAKKLYAELNQASDDTGSLTTPNDAADFSPERLLHETPDTARYEKLGPETITQRTTTRYRVTSINAASVTLIWIDDALGIPVRSETISPGSDHGTKVTVELQDLKQTVDPRVFELPGDYRKVDYRQLVGEMTQSPGTPRAKD